MTAILRLLNRRRTETHKCSPADPRAAPAILTERVRVSLRGCEATKVTIRGSMQRKFLFPDVSQGKIVIDHNREAQAGASRRPSGLPARDAAHVSTHSSTSIRPSADLLYRSRAAPCSNTPTINKNSKSPRSFTTCMAPWGMHLNHDHHASYCAPLTDDHRTCSLPQRTAILLAIRRAAVWLMLTREWHP
jgi:hypothetical protein